MPSILKPDICGSSKKWKKNFPERELHTHNVQVQSHQVKKILLGVRVAQEAGPEGSSPSRSISAEVPVA